MCPIIYKSHFSKHLATGASKFIFCIKKKEIDQSHLSIPFLVLSCRNQGIPTSMDILFSMYRSFFSSRPLYHT